MSYVIKEPLGDFNILFSFKGNLTATEVQIFTFPFMLKKIGVSCTKYTTKRIYSLVLAQISLIAFLPSVRMILCPGS